LAGGGAAVVVAKAGVLIRARVTATVWMPSRSFFMVVSMGFFHPFETASADVSRREHLCGYLYIFLKMHEWPQR
jgi:hypothetical protein